MNEKEFIAKAREVLEEFMAIPCQYMCHECFLGDEHGLCNKLIGLGKMLEVE